MTDNPYKEIEALWEKHCIEGTFDTPTDTMYYEGFVDAIKEAIASAKEEGGREMINELYKMAFLYSDGSHSLMTSYLERKYRDILESLTPPIQE